MVSGGKDPFDLVAGTADVVVTTVIISNTADYLCMLANCALFF